MLDKQLNPLGCPKMLEALARIAQHLSPRDVEAIASIPAEEAKKMLRHSVAGMVYRWEHKELYETN